MKAIKCPQCETRVIHLVKDEYEEKKQATFTCVGCNIEFDFNYEVNQTQNIKQLPERKRTVSRSVQERLDMIREFYANMSDEEFKERMGKAGFEVVAGQPGEVFADEKGGDAE